MLYLLPYLSTTLGFHLLSVSSQISFFVLLKSKKKIFFFRLLLILNFFFIIPCNYFIVVVAGVILNSTLTSAQKNRVKKIIKTNFSCKKKLKKYFFSIKYFRFLKLIDRIVFFFYCCRNSNCIDLSPISGRVTRAPPTNTLNIFLPQHLL